MKGLWVFLISSTLFGGNYFQQSVHYYIHVTLNAKERTYEGDETVVYRNNSPDTLKFIWFHLYPNAFKNTRTPFALQQKRFCRRHFFFSRPEERGFLEISDVKCDGEKTTFTFAKNAIDEVKIYLPQPLLPGDSVRISMKFKGKFPHVFSRMGYYNKGYFIATHWYPKVVVYDQRGWHPDSYLDQGEFYGEYGKFDVWITLPECFVVDATGILKDPHEEEFLEKLADTTKYALSLKGKERKKFIKNWIKSRLKDLDTCSTMKTLHFVADSVHNFAWFAGVQYLLFRKRHNGGVITNVLVAPQDIISWKDVPEYVEKAISFYSEKVGPFRYPKASVVDGSIRTAGGMEYPMITIVGVKNVPYTHILEDVVIHEVGHNWFMGMIGSDERAYPFLDEGLNSFLESKYLAHHYGRYNLTDLKEVNLFGLQLVHDIGYLDIVHLAYGLKLSTRTDQPMNLRSEQFSMSNYSIINYYKGVLLLRALEWYLTPEIFWKGMREYYKRWSFKHPDVDDFFNVFEEVSGKDLEWFKKDWYMGRSFNDFVIRDYKTVAEDSAFVTTVHVENKGTMKDFPAPVFLITENGDTLTSRWSPGKPVVFRHTSPVKHIEVNMKHEIFESNYINNSKGFPRPKIRFLPGIPDFEHFSITIFPYVWNEGFVDGRRFGVKVQTGNPLIKQYYSSTLLYYSSKSKKVGYGFEIANRYHPPFSNFLDISLQFMDQDGLKRQTLSVSQFWQRPDNDCSYKKLSVSFSHLNLYDTRYYNPGIFEKANYWSFRINSDLTLNTMLDELSMHFGLKIGAAEKVFAKLENQGRLRHYFGESEYFEVGYYAGGILGSGFPAQERIYASGDPDPEHARFYPVRRGTLSPGKHWSTGRGMGMFGYQDPVYNGKLGFSLTGALKVWHLPQLYFTGGVLGDSDFEFLKEAGLRLGFSNRFLTAMLVLPVYTNSGFKFRWGILFSSMF